MFTLLLEDLRFFIGAFFVIVGVLLVGQGLINPLDTAGVNLNLIVGICFFIFGSGALAMAVTSARSQRR